MLSSDIRRERPCGPPDRSASLDVALVGHGQFGCSLAVRWIGLPVTVGQHLQLDPASFRVLTFNPSHPGLPIIAQWNATAAA
jgi:broad specificity phosphatase PhoE